MLTSDFPTECSSQIFSYLDVADCLNFTATSICMMKEMLPSLNDRRLRIKQPYSYIIDRKEIRNGVYMTTKVFGPYKSMKEKYPKMEHMILPTLDEHVSELNKTVPSKHPLHQSLLELHDTLDKETEHNTLIFVAPVFTKLFPLYRNLIRPLKTYVQVVEKLLLSDPISENAGCGRVSLDRYIGDVLCMLHLFNEPTSCLNELGIPLNNAIQNIRSGLQQVPVYMSWIMLHCAILKSKRFTTNERKRLGVRSSGFRHTGSTILPMDCYVTDAFMSSELMLVLDTFGPLGSSFRMRDIVHTHELSAHCLLTFYNSIENSDDDEDDNIENPYIITRGHAGDISTEWIMLAHEEARKVRPMTVRQPVVKFSWI